MSCAFNMDLIADFSSPMTVIDTANILRSYNVTNIRKDISNDYFNVFNADLFRDYAAHRANLLGYVREGIDARVLWELRKSAILWDFMCGLKNAWFFEAHQDNWGVEEIKRYRISVLEKKFADYDDLDWQYFWVLWTGLKDWKEIRIDAEMLFDDYDPSKPDNLGDPIKDYLWRIFKTPGYKPKVMG